MKEVGVEGVVESPKTVAELVREARQRPGSYEEAEKELEGLKRKVSRLRNERIGLVLGHLDAVAREVTDRIREEYPLKDRIKRSSWHDRVKENLGGEVFTMFVYGSCWSDYNSSGRFRIDVYIDVHGYWERSGVKVRVSYRYPMTSGEQKKNQYVYGKYADYVQRICQDFDEVDFSYDGGRSLDYDDWLLQWGHKPARRRTHRW